MGHRSPTPDVAHLRRLARREHATVHWVSPDIRATAWGQSSRIGEESGKHFDSMGSPSDARVDEDEVALISMGRFVHNGVVAQFLSMAPDRTDARFAIRVVLER